MRYRVEFADGTVQNLKKSSAKRYLRREDFKLIGLVLKQIAIKAASSVDWLTRMPPADIKNIEKPAVKNHARTATIYGNGSEQTRELFDAALHQCNADWAAALK